MISITKLFESFITWRKKNLPGTPTLPNRGTINKIEKLNGKLKSNIKKII
jgi:hypothetical protein